MSHADTSPPNATPSIEDRLNAIELLLQQLVLLLEAEPEVTAARLSAWAAIAAGAMRAHGSATEGQLAALARLVERLT